MAAKGIHHVALCVNNWESSKEFYNGLFEAMGAQRVMDLQGAPHCHDEGHMAAYAGEGFMVTIWESTPEHRSNEFKLYNVGLHHVAFAASSREDVDALHGKIESLGGKVLNAPKEYDYVPGYYATYFTDPEGLKLEYVHL